MSLNSTMVQFKFILKMKMMMKMRSVSIPLWFNSNKFNLAIKDVEKKYVSIPLWFNSNKDAIQVFNDYVYLSQFHYGSIQIPEQVLKLLNFN